MYQPEKLSELISEIYDAAVDPSLWRDVVGKAGRFVGGLAAAIFAKSAATGNGRYDIYSRQPVEFRYAPKDAQMKESGAKSSTG